jgi:hypothetical protein
MPFTTGIVIGNLLCSEQPTPFGQLYGKTHCFRVSPGAVTPLQDFAYRD